MPPAICVAAETLGDVVFVELPDVGAEVKQFTKFGEIESVKAVSDLYSPISGSIVKVNENLVSKPELVNQDAYGDGWLIKILPTNLQELDSLMSSTDYKKFTDGPQLCGYKLHTIQEETSITTLTVLKAINLKN